VDAIDTVGRAQFKRPFLTAHRRINARAARSVSGDGSPARVIVERGGSCVLPSPYFRRR
jgi:hypothetical protein